MFGQSAGTTSQAWAWSPGRLERGSFLHFKRISFFLDVYIQYRLNILNSIQICNFSKNASQETQVFRKGTNPKKPPVPAAVFAAFGSSCGGPANMKHISLVELRHSKQGLSLTLW